jgi:hypothetical protein
MMNSATVITKTVKDSEKGSAIVVALLVLALMSVFVALAMSRSSTEAMAVGNETAEARTFYAAQGSLETMTRNFNKIFERRLNPTTVEIGAVSSTLPIGMPGFTFNQEPLVQVSDRQVKVLTGGPYAGLNSIQDGWRLRTTATDDNTGTQIQLTRNVLNNRIPIFQFGVFYDDDLELFNGPQFAFGGRVHSNRHFFLHPSANGAYFDSRVTAAGHIVTQTKRNGDTVNITTANIQIKNGSGVFRTLAPNEGSVLNGAPNVFTDPQLPSSYLNSAWPTIRTRFDGNLQSEVKPLRLPLNIGNNADLIELIKRGKIAPTGSAGGDLNNNNGTVEPVTSGSTGTEDSPIVRTERFANKTGIRISLADSQAKLPGCASGAGLTPITVTPPARCGVRLDGDIIGRGAVSPSPTPTSTPELSRGYQPKSMRSTSGGPFTYTPTRVNGERLTTGGTREVWIKIETVRTDPVTGATITVDITEDILSLGVTEQVLTSHGVSFPAGYNQTPETNSITATAPQTPTGGTDSRSVVKLQRWVIPGPAIPGSMNALYSYPAAAPTMNVVRRFLSVDDTDITDGCLPAANCTAANNGPANEQFGHIKRATVDGVNDVAIVPFPIQMYDVREGFYYDGRTTSYYADLSQVPWNGVMSLIDIDVANLRRFFRGDYNGLFPVDTPFAISNGGVGLVNTDIPQDRGWVIYVSDRRGDANFDGEYDMEDVYGANPGNDDVLQSGEDLDKSGTYGFGVLDRAYITGEAVRYNVTTTPDYAAVNDHQYYRRGVRLINGQTIPGIYDSGVPDRTRGFTLASENGVYVKGNYNATGVSSVPALGSGNTRYDQYLPFNDPLHIPASVVADAITILSNNWNDAASFRSPVTSPYNQSLRPATTTQMRFAMIAGDPITSIIGDPNQGPSGSGDRRENGGLHNFKRFLENWGGQRLDYTGSLINLYNSRNNNGTYKCCATVYSPPRRNWVFDATFLDPNRIPPGTPFFQYVQTTGFLRTNN